MLSFKASFLILGFASNGNISTLKDNIIPRHQNFSGQKNGLFWPRHEITITYFFEETKNKCAEECKKKKQVYPEISNWLEILFSQGGGVGELENILYILKSTEKTLN